MKKRKLICLIIISVLAFDVICIVSWNAMQKHFLKGDYEYLCDQIEQGLQQDDVFIKLYGDNITVALDPDMKLIRTNGYVKNVHCLIKTDHAAYSAVIAYDTKNNTYAIDYSTIKKVISNEPTC